MPEVLLAGLVGPRRVQQLQIDELLALLGRQGDHRRPQHQRLLVCLGVLTRAGLQVQGPHHVVCVLVCQADSARALRGNDELLMPPCGGWSGCSQAAVCTSAGTS